MPRTRTLRLVVVSTMIGAALVVGVAQVAPGLIIFRAGDPVSADAMNHNFAHLEGRIDVVSADVATIEAVPGPQGPQGEAGPQGPQGDAGPQGVQGDAGPQGEAGPQGDRGEPGSQGERGLQGEPGEPGLPGERGEPGLQGERGEPGLPGERGEPGLPGERGEPGAQGERGEAGAQGNPGPQGTQGLQGAPGPQGPQGLPGPAGTFALTVVNSGPYVVPATSEVLHLVVIGPQSLVLPVNPAAGQYLVVQATDSNGTIDFGARGHDWETNPGLPEVGVWDFTDNNGMTKHFALYWDGSAWQWLNL